MQTQQQVRVYHLASGGHPRWPYTVDYAPEHPGGHFYLGSGDTRNGNGGFFSAYQVLEPRFRSDLETAEALWLIPLLERISGGEGVTPEEVLAAYRAQHGNDPSSSVWTLY